jgi:hypothetical protein
MMKIKRKTAFDGRPTHDKAGVVIVGKGLSERLTELEEAAERYPA